MLLVCFAFIFCRLLTLIRYNEEYFTIMLPDYVPYNEEFVISRICSIYITVTLAGLQNIFSYIEDFFKWRFDKSRFYCNMETLSPLALELSQNLF